MDTAQIYNIVNEINAQALGKALNTVINADTFIAYGQKVLSSTELTENFCNELVLRITRTIISYRKYNSKYRPIVFDDLRWGAIVQKIKAEMPTASADMSYDLKDGESVDMYVVAKPKLHQKFFVSRTPYNFFVTIQGWQLERAFVNERSFAAMLAAIYGEVQNKLEMTFEGLGRTTLNASIANCLGTSQEIKLLTMYKTETKKTLTAEQAMFDSDFLRYAVAKMNVYAVKLEVMSNLYNAEEFTRHTPKSDQRFATIVDYKEQLATVVQWAAFQERYVTMESGMELPFWQSPDSPFEINVTDENGTEINGKNIIAVIHDRDALGTYRKERKVLTTPVNAAGDYVNTFWHEEQMWFIDRSENELVFTLN